MKGKKTPPTHLRTFTVERSERERKKNKKKQMRNCYKTTGLVARFFPWKKKDVSEKDFWWFYAMSYHLSLKSL